MTQTLYVGRCRAAGRKHGLRSDQSCEEPVLPTHGLFCRKHYDRIKRQVRGGRASWEDFERGFRRVTASDKANTPGSPISDSKRRYINELEPTFASANPVSRSAEKRLTPKVRKKLRALKQRLDPNAIPGTYAEGKLESTVSYTLRFPETHSCIWLHPDGTIRNYGPHVPATFWDEEIEPSPQAAVRTEKPLAPLTSDMRVCRKCCRWAARTHCTVCDEELVQRQPTASGAA